MSNRREFIAGLGAMAGSPLSVRAQQPAMPVIGYLHVGSATVRRDEVVAFKRGLSESGFVEGRNVTIEYRWADDQQDRLPGLLSDLLRLRVTVIVAPSGTNTVLAAKALNVTVPIVFSTALDPVQSGLVASLNRPGGNVTGLISMGVDIVAKQVGLLRELLPRAERFAVLVNPKALPSEAAAADARAAASAIGRSIEVLSASSNSDIDAAFANLVQKGCDALLVSSDSLFVTRRAQLITLTARSAVPAIFPYREDAEAGGLMSYGSDILDRERQVGLYTSRILKGESPADLPIGRASKFQFIINLQTAKIIGIEVPPTLLAIADEVIE